MLSDDPEAPTTIKQRFNYGPLTGGKVDRLGGRSTPARSQSLDPRQPPARRSAERRAPRVGRDRRRRGRAAAQAGVELLVVAPKRSATGNTLAVMGPQLGYYYPEIVAADAPQRPGDRGAGRRRAGPRDVHPDRPHAELRVEPDLGQPRRARRVRRAALRARRLGADARLDHYLFKGVCRPFEDFNAGTLQGTPLRYPTSVHGPVIGTATVDGKPYALTRQRSTFGRDGLNLGRAQGHDRGQGVDAAALLRRRPTSSASRSTGPTRPARTTAYFSSGHLPRRAPRPRPPAADARHRPVRVAGLPRRARAPARRAAARAGCC